jgi:NADPH:quinone reductase-like Zn-dependent oxidoreductase
VEPAAKIVHGVIGAKIEAGDFAVAVGPGPIGQLAAMAARAGGARRMQVIVTKKDEAVRLTKARELGFDTLVAGGQDTLESVLEMTGGIGARLVVECSGSTPGIASAIDLVRKKGRVSAIGLTGKPSIPFRWDKAAFQVCDLMFNLATGYTLGPHHPSGGLGRAAHRQGNFAPRTFHRMGPGDCRDRRGACIKGIVDTGARRHHAGFQAWIRTIGRRIDCAVSC